MNSGTRVEQIAIGFRIVGVKAIACDEFVNVFETFIEKVLCPTLRSGDIVVMDNLSSHKGARVGRLIEECGAELFYLPPYSPDFSPIEPAFSKVKQGLRSLECRTQAALWKSMQSVLDKVTASDALNFFAHCGYHLT